MVEINKLVRSKRKTLSLIVEKDATLTVRAPQRMKDSEIWEFVEQKADWIKRKQVQAREDAPVQRNFVDGETIPYLGEEIPLRIVPHGRPALVMDSVFKLSQAAQNQAKSIFEAWYKRQARAVLTECVGYFAHSHNLQPGKVRISSARTRWGSCSPKRTLSFTWRLVMAPMEVIDYVVVHELCHLEEMNHSKAFWAQVASILPDYKMRRKWLKVHGKFLVL